MISSGGTAGGEKRRRLDRMLPHGMLELLHLAEQAKWIESLGDLTY